MQEHILCSDLSLLGLCLLTLLALLSILFCFAQYMAFDSIFKSGFRKKNKQQKKQKTFTPPRLR